MAGRVFSSRPRESRSRADSPGDCHGQAEGHQRADEQAPVRAGTTILKLKLMSFRQVEGGEGVPLPPPAANPAVLDGAFLADVERRNAIIIQQTIAAAKNTINQARRHHGNRSHAGRCTVEAATGSAVRYPELTPDVRMQLLGQLEQALRATSAAATRHSALELQGAKRLAKVEAQQAMLRLTYDKQAKIQQISQRMQALMDEDGLEMQIKRQWRVPAS